MHRPRLLTDDTLIVGHDEALLLPPVVNHKGTQLTALHENVFVTVPAAFMH